MPASVQVLWVPEREDGVLTRGQIDPCSRKPSTPVTLDWVKKHAKPCLYRVRWWEGDSDTKGTWREQEFSIESTCREVRSFAAEVARTSTVFEVFISILGTNHGRNGYEYRAPVWNFGHFKRDDEQSRKIRGELES